MRCLQDGHWTAELIAVSWFVKKKFASEYSEAANTGSGLPVNFSFTNFQEPLIANDVFYFSIVIKNSP